MPLVPPSRKAPPGSSDLMKALKTAFNYRWNLLAFFGGMAGAAVSGHPDIVLPFVAAGELAYLWGMVSFPKFRKAVAREGYQSPSFPREPVPAKDPAAAIRGLVQQLPRDAQARFEALRTRCIEMRDIARGVRGRAGDPHAETIGAPALDRLLWSFLRLLVSQGALNRFLQATNGPQLEQQAKELQARLARVQAPAAGQVPDARLLRSLTDSVAVAELRVENYRKAQANAEFVQIELDRIEAKINALTEMAVNRQDPDFLSSQVDAAADSMAQTESTMAELQSITGLVDDLEEPPPILESDLKSYDVA